MSPLWGTVGGRGGHLSIVNQSPVCPSVVVIRYTFGLPICRRLWHHVADTSADMEVQMVAEMEVDKMANEVAYMADMVAVVAHGGRQGGRHAGRHGGQQPQKK